jgi:hypothetical protein
MESHFIPNAKNQDFVGTGRIQDIDYLFAFDGHGTDKVIHQIRNMNMDDIATSHNPVLAVHEKLIGDTYLSGATMSFARIQGNRVESYNCGDSQVHIYLNGTRVHQSIPHTFTNLDEIKRTASRVTSIKPTKAPFPVSDTVIRDVLSPTGRFITGEELVPSQSLGHNDMTGLAPEYFTVTVSPTDHLRIVVGSDGFWDMMVDPSKGTAKALTQEAHRRWMQTWTYESGGQTVRTDFGGDIDDIGVAVYDNVIQFRPALCIPWSPPSFTTDQIRMTFEAVMGGVLRVDELVKPTHKVFFVHFLPMKMDEKNKKVYEILAKRPLKVYYSDDWFWNVSVSHYTAPMRCVDDVYGRWDGVCPYEEFADSQVSEWSIYKINRFLVAF